MERSLGSRVRQTRANAQFPLGPHESPLTGHCLRVHFPQCFLWCCPRPVTPPYLRDGVHGNLVLTCLRGPVSFMFTGFICQHSLFSACLPQSCVALTCIGSCIWSYHKFSRFCPGSEPALRTTSRFAQAVAGFHSQGCPVLWVPKPHFSRTNTSSNPSCQPPVSLHHGPSHN